MTLENEEVFEDETSQIPSTSSSTGNNPRTVFGQKRMPARASVSAIKDGEVTIPTDQIERDRLIFTTLLQIKAMVKNNTIALSRLEQKLKEKRSPDVNIVSIEE
ncbi:uncharacterized protein LOC106168097 [Lingula anatina]|uniref:Uncharacterized protein LOC106168097 n=1 Tax=Lingula anatina TaxID=7574 RepID=A0A1S3IWC4_LINAN|nr:uncharacterized protein LOC106168097 [Lingula anatina]|eukprot:XP_013402490.1 uncharacterized protein LOC106168097 [Lingula anatina]